MRAAKMALAFSGWCLLGLGCEPGGEGDTHSAPPPAPRQPHLIDWAKLTNAAPRVRKEACMDLEEPNAETVAALIHMLADPDQDVRFAAGTRLLHNRHPGKMAALVQALDSKQLTQRYEAAHVLGRIGISSGGDARPAKKKLKKALADADEHLRVYAALALSRVGEEFPPALAVLASGLLSSDPSLVDTAFDGLANYSRFHTSFFAEQLPPTVVGNALLVLSRRDADFRARAACLLGDCGDRSPAVFAELSRALADRDFKVRQVAAFSFSDLQFPNPPDEVFPILCHFLNTHDGSERQRTCWALERLNRFPPCVVETLTAHLEDEDPVDRLEVACLLSRHPGTSTAAVESALVALLQTHHYELYDLRRVKAIQALGRLGLHSPEARAAVQRAARADPSKEVRDAARDVLRSVPPTTLP